ncbi:hypothetical protein L9F63_025725, partial [Diploptera punctata]
MEYKGDDKDTASEEKLPWGPQRKKRKIHGYKEDPFVFFTEDEPLWPSIRDFYGIDSQLHATCLLTRCKEGKKKNIYFTSPAVRDIIINNQDKNKVNFSTIPTIYKYEAMTCAFRLAQEGLHSICPYIGPKRRIKVSKDDLIKLLTCENPKFPPETSSMDAATQEQLSSIDAGSCILVMKVKEMHQVMGYVPVNDCIHYLRLCGADVSKFEINKYSDIRVGVSFAHAQKNRSNSPEHESYEEGTALYNDFAKVVTNIYE